MQRNRYFTSRYLYILTLTEISGAESSKPIVTKSMCCLKVFIVQNNCYN